MSRAVDRTLAILDFLSQHDEPAGVREIAGRLDMPPAAAQRVLAALHRTGFVRRQPPSGRFVLGTKVVQIAARVLARMELPRIAAPILRDIRERCDETISLFVLEGAQRVCIASDHSSQGVRRVLPVGTALPLWAGASGKVLLAFLPEETQEALLDRLDIQPFTAHTPTDRESLRRELVKIREQGHGVSFGERVPDAASVAAPVRDARGLTVAAFTISAPKMRWTAGRAPMLIGLAVEGARRVSEELGFVQRAAPARPAAASRRR